ncbi:ThiF family adenylyltransferase, partial [Pseudoalteromonas sp. Q18-MNA-CIBAN-0097]
MNELSDKETLRYSRHLLLEEVGLEGQLTLKSSTVAVVGAGGLGSPALLYLAAAGVGTLILIDDDEVELSNLQRQVLYKINHLGQNKVTAA